MLSPKKQDQITTLMAQLNIAESDLDEQFVHGSGSGGQKLNKTASCVVLTHIPTGTQVKCQQDRSREINRFLARRLLCERLAPEQGIQTAAAKRQAKKQKQKQRRKRKSATKYQVAPTTPPDDAVS